MWCHSGVMFDFACVTCGVRHTSLVLQTPHSHSSEKCSSLFEEVTCDAVASNASLVARCMYNGKRWQLQPSSCSLWRFLQQQQHQHHHQHQQQQHEHHQQQQHRRRRQQQQMHSIDSPLERACAWSSGANVHSGCLCRNFYAAVRTRSNAEYVSDVTYLSHRPHLSFLSQQEE